MLRMAALLAAMSIPAPAQRGGSVAAGRVASGLRPGHPLPGQPLPGIGWRPPWGWRDQPAVPWFGTLVWPLPVFPAAPYSSCANAFCDAGPDAPPAVDMRPPVNVVVMPAQPYVPSPESVPVGGESARRGLPNLPQASSATDSQSGREISFGEGAGFHWYQAPFSSPITLDEYPPLIVLKTGGVYSVVKYWMQNGNLYFVTPGGENRYAPLALVEHVYPRVKHGQIATE
jgi:hypothetical protein